MCKSKQTANGYILSEQETGEDCIQPKKMPKGTWQDES